MHFNSMKVGSCGKTGPSPCHFDMCIGQSRLERSPRRSVDIACVMLFETTFFGHIYGIGDAFEINMHVNSFSTRQS